MALGLSAVRKSLHPAKRPETPTSARSAEARLSRFVSARMNDAAVIVASVGELHRKGVPPRHRRREDIGASVAARTVRVVVHFGVKPGVVRPKCEVVTGEDNVCRLSSGTRCPPLWRG